MAPYADRIKKVIMAQHHRYDVLPWMKTTHVAPVVKGANGGALNDFAKYVDGHNSAISLLEMNGLYPKDEKITRLVDATGGIARDADVSWDGERVLFAWKSHFQVG